MKRSSETSDLKSAVSRVARTAALAAMLMTGAAIIATPARAGDQEGEIRARLTPVVAHAPATVRLNVRVLPHVENRRLRVTLDSGEYLRSSDLPLEGDQAASMHSFRWPDVPSGKYVVFVEVVRSNGKSRTIQVGSVEIVGLAD
jgi:hypothetical protein